MLVVLNRLYSFYILNLKIRQQTQLCFIVVIIVKFKHAKTNNYTTLYLQSSFICFVIMFPLIYCLI